MEPFDEFLSIFCAVVEEWGSSNVVMLIPHSARVLDMPSNLRAEQSSREELVGFAVELEGIRYLTKEFKL
jgi:hypothetical protein